MSEALAGRVGLLVGVAAGAIVLAAGVVLWIASGEDDGAGGPRHPQAPPFVVFRALAPPDAHGRVVTQGLGPQPATRRVSDLHCMRVHYAGGRGLCAVQRAGTMVHDAYVFDGDFTRGPSLELRGVPTRLRVAPSGEVGAISVYAEEESESGERLATRSLIVDMRTAAVIADLHEFRLDVGRFPPVTGPVDIASVAFERAGDRFFATLSTAAERYLVGGSIGERRLTALATGVLNEALSPDGRRLAVKKPLGPLAFWRVAVIDLDTWETRDLVHPRSVDDQVEWLDDEHVVFHDADGERTSVWMLAAGGLSPPRVFLEDAYSASVQHK